MRCRLRGHCSVYCPPCWLAHNRKWQRNALVGAIDGTMRAWAKEHAAKWRDAFDRIVQLYIAHLQQRAIIISCICHADRQVIRDLRKCSSPESNRDSVVCLASLMMANEIVGTIEKIIDRRITLVIKAPNEGGFAMRETRTNEWTMI